MKVTMIVGVPCVGKSTLVRRVMAHGEWEYRSPLYVPHHVSTSLTILGRYDTPHQFPGTDRMSMAAQPHVLNWIPTCATALLFEGARLGNGKMLDALRVFTNDIEVIELIGDVRERRLRERVQTETFLKRAESQVRGVVRAAAAFNIPVRTCRHETADDMAIVSTHIWMNRT